MPNTKKTKKLNTLRREDKILLVNKGGELNFDLMDRNNVEVLSADDNYFIYMKNVYFKRGGIIQGRYLGVMSDDNSLLSFCNQESVRIDEEGKFTYNGKPIRKARLMAIDNKNKIIIMIGSEI